MSNKVNIIIPSIQLSQELIFCLKKIEKQKFRNFFVTIVLDKKNFKLKPKFNFKLNILIVGKKSMSYKRNFAAKKFQSKYLAFIDSDTYTGNKWLLSAIILLKNKKFNVVGGPNIPFPNQSYLEKISHYAKRSYYVTGYLNFRKYKANARLCEWLESCNFLIQKKTYFDIGGMDAAKYLGEDKDFFERANRKDKNFKTFYSPQLYIHHKERSPYKLLIQRFIFGTDIFNIIKFKNNINSFQPLLPILIISTFSFILLYGFNLKLKIYLILSLLLLIQFLIIYDVMKYIRSVKIILLTTILINLANISFGLGSFLAFFGLNKNLIRKIYLKSRNNK